MWNTSHVVYKIGDGWLRLDSCVVVTIKYKAADQSLKWIKRIMYVYLAPKKEVSGIDCIMRMMYCHNIYFLHVMKNI